MVQRLSQGLRHIQAQLPDLPVTYDPESHVGQIGSILGMKRGYKDFQFRSWRIIDFPYRYLICTVEYLGHEVGWERQILQGVAGYVIPITTAPAFSGKQDH